MTGADADAPARTLALVESPVQLLNLLEWAHAERGGPRFADARGSVDAAAHGSVDADASGDAVGSGDDAPGACTVVVLPPRDPMSRGQLRRMAELARDEGLAVRWCEPRTASAGPLRTLAGLAPSLMRASRLVLGDPFSRFVQALLPFSRARELVVIDDGTATMEFATLIAEGRRLVRWHRAGGSRGPRDLAFAAFAAHARRRLTAGRGTGIELFSAMPVTAPPGAVVRPNRLEWTRARFGPPKLRDGADLIGTSLVESGVVDHDRYLAAVAAIAEEGGATRYFAHRREREDKLRELSRRTGLEIVRPDLPLELVARRGPIGSRLLSFPSTVVHTLPLALAGTGVRVDVLEVDPSWLTGHASPRAHGFLSGITQAARSRHGLGTARNPLTNSILPAVTS
ncbi:hypothetical protein K7472_03670 [Streptomyces sp. PTM05]|uniref:Uncharacterized protein n=1 Tax=Streptantibioticus parmotrematis TaxID=2873249 RepID=A0ABS7QL72_9ACTN|nr:hypothetical protein [Streptantibioticus parmotrematis]MBY8883940.1 hypothetical protein [Streptantibioticus parmotrematis]